MQINNPIDLFMHLDVVTVAICYCLFVFQKERRGDSSFEHSTNSLDSGKFPYNLSWTALESVTATDLIVLANRSC